MSKKRSREEDYDSSSSSSSSSSDSENENNKRVRRTLSSHDESEDDSVQQQLQQQQTEADRGPEPGGIKRIVLKNFMCHTKLDIDFHPNVTYISGANGSGKSAILTAIQVCLGTKASATNRGSSMKELIKTGKQTAEVTIHMRNEGVDAYKPEVYGNELIVTRLIDRDAGGKYVIKAADGTVVARTSKELRAILSQFNIYTDNPLTIMTQDTSRRFLHSEGPKGKYQFFMQATQLQRILDSFEEARKHQTTIRNNLEAKMDLLKQEEKRLAENKDIIDAMDKIKSYEERLRELADLFMWVNVDRTKKMMEHFVQKLEKQTAVTDEDKKKRENLQREIDQQTTFLNTCRGELSKMTAELDKAQRATGETQHQITNLLRSEREVHGRISAEEDRIKTCERAIKANEKQIQALQKQQQVDRSPQVTEHQKKVTLIENRIGELQETLKKEQTSLQGLDRDLEKIREREREIRDELRVHKSAVQKYNSEISMYQSKERDKFSYFDQNQRKSMKQILQLIARHKSSFEEIPIGPVGLLIEPRDLKWAPGIEFAIINGLKNFYFDNKADLERFNRILENEGFRKVPAIIQKFSRNKYNVNHVDGHQTIYDQLKLDESILSKLPYEYDKELLESSLFNILVDQAGIESSILIESRDEAERVMFKSDRPPRYVNDCYLPNATRLFKKGGSENIQTRNMTYSELWTASHEVQIAQISQLMRQSESQAQAVERKVRECEEQKRHIEKDIASARGTINGTHNQISRLTSEKKRLEVEIKALTDAQDFDNSEQITELEQAIASKMEEIKKHQQKIQSIREDQSSVVARMDELEQQLQDRKHAEAEAKRNSEEYQARLHKLMNNLALARKRMDQSDKTLDEAKGILITLRARVEEFTSQYEDALKVANERTNGPVSLTGETPEQIAKQQQQTQQQLDNQKRKLNIADPTRFRAKYSNEIEFYKQKKASLDHSSKLYQQIREGFQYRYAEWKHLRQRYAIAVSQLFCYYMEQRGHSGAITVDDQNQTLELKITLNKGGNVTPNGNETVKDTKSLSGGERSFATVSFVLALWTFVESPLRALDEFDIFMDTAYRKKSLECILAAAVTKHKNNQIILISPHDTSQLGQIDRNKIKVYRMPDPQRLENQHTMNEYLSSHQ